MAFDELKINKSTVFDVYVVDGGGWVVTPWSLPHGTWDALARADGFSPGNVHEVVPGSLYAVHDAGHGSGSAHRRVIALIVARPPQAVPVRVSQELPTEPVFPECVDPVEYMREQIKVFEAVQTKTAGYGSLDPRPDGQWQRCLFQAANGLAPVLPSTPGDWHLSQQVGSGHAARSLSEAARRAYLCVLHMPREHRPRMLEFLRTYCWRLRDHGTGLESAS